MEKKTKKSTKQETLEHILEIYKMMCEGKHSLKIIEYGRQNWGLKRAEMYKLINRALAWLKEKYSKSLEEYRSEANIRFDQLFEKLYAEGKYKDAAYVQGQKNKINGILINDVNHHHIITNEREIQDELEKLAKKKIDERIN